MSIEKSCHFENTTEGAKRKVVAQKEQPEVRFKESNIYFRYEKEWSLVARQYASMSLLQLHSIFIREMRISVKSHSGSSISDNSNSLHHITLSN